jgi:tripartite-type tricarboxylate transporter receptor subunit TctC
MSVLKHGLLAAAIALLQPLASAPARAADDYPSKPISLVLPFAPGGPSDVIARTIANKLAANLKQPVVVLNTPGAGGMIASASVARAEPDGYTLFYPNASTLAIAPQLSRKPGPEPLTQFAPVAPVLKFSLVLVANPSVAAKNLKELVQAAKAQPDKFSFASAGNGTTPHLVGELFKREAGISMLHVPYKGGSPAVLALLAGQVDLFFEQTLTVAPHVRTGKLKALAVTGKTRMDFFPDVPTVAESGYPGLALESWSAIVAPAGTPPAVVALLNREINKVLAMPEVRDAIASRGLEPTTGTPDDLARLIREEWARWTPVIKSQYIEAD